MACGLPNRAALPVPSFDPNTPAWPASVVTTPAGVICRIVLLPCVGDIHRARGVHRHALRTIESRGATGAVGVPTRSPPGLQASSRCRRVQFSGSCDCFGPPHTRYPCCRLQFLEGLNLQHCRAVALRSTARECCHDAGGRDCADPANALGDIHRAGTVHRYPLGITESRGAACPVGASGGVRQARERRDIALPG